MAHMTHSELLEQYNKFFGVFPRIELERIRLRQLRDEDVQPYYEYITHPRVARYVPTDCLPNSVNTAHSDISFWIDSFASQNSIHWAIADAKTDKIIGTTALTRLLPIQRKANITYDLDFEYWGQGLMRDAVGAVLDYVDKYLELLRVQANIAVTNDRSIKLVRLFGFEHEGIMKKYEVLNWEHEDFDVYGRIR